MDYSNNSQNVSTDHVSIQSSFDGWCYLPTDTQSDMNDRDRYNDSVNTNIEYKPETLNSSNKNQDELGESETFNCSSVRVCVLLSDTILHFNWLSQLFEFNNLCSASFSVSLISLLQTVSKAGSIRDV
jgi:hypothetical protein